MSEENLIPVKIGDCLECVNNNEFDYLTEGNLYRVLSIEKVGQYECHIGVLDDEGSMCFPMDYRFDCQVIDGILYHV